MEILETKIMVTSAEYLSTCCSIHMKEELINKTNPLITGTPEFLYCSIKGMLE
jgi:hypothetical protein